MCLYEVFVLEIRLLFFIGFLIMIIQATQHFSSLENTTCEKVVKINIIEIVCNSCLIYSRIYYCYYCYNNKLIRKVITI